MKKGHPNLKRNLILFKDILNGTTAKEAGVKFKISGERVAQCTKRLAILLKSTKYCHEEVPKHSFYTIIGRRRQKEFWLRQIDAFEKLLKTNSKSFSKK